MNKDGDKGGKNKKKKQLRGKKNKEAIGGVGGKKDQYDSMDSDNEDGKSSGSSRKGVRKGKSSRKDNDKSEGLPNFNISGGAVWNYDGPNTGKDDSSRVQLDILKDPRYFHFSNEFGVGFTDDGGVFFPKITDFKFDE